MSIKRGSDMRDSGSLIPEYDGMPDRLDSLFFTAAFSTLYHSRSNIVELSMKRGAGVKDSDSLLFTAPTFYYVSLAK